MSKNWQKNLASVFIHPMHEYNFVKFSEGESFCACGHPIKNIYTVACNGHEVELGSECIENYVELEKVRQQVQAEEERRKELERLQREHLQNQELEALIKEYSDLLRPYRQQIIDRIRIDYTVWQYCVGRKGYQISKLKTLKGKIKAVGSALEGLKGSIKRSEKGAA